MHSLPRQAPVVGSEYLGATIPTMAIIRLVIAKHKYNIGSSVSHNSDFPPNDHCENDELHYATESMINASYRTRQALLCDSRELCHHMDGAECLKIIIAFKTNCQLGDLLHTRNERNRACSMVEKNIGLNMHG